MERQEMYKLFEYDPTQKKALQHLAMAGEPEERNLYRNKVKVAYKSDAYRYMIPYKKQMNELYLKSKKRYIFFNGPITKYQEDEYKKLFRKQMLNLFNDWLEIYRYFQIGVQDILEWVYNEPLQTDMFEHIEDESIITVKFAVFDYLDYMKPIKQTQKAKIKTVRDMIRQAILSSLYTYNTFYYDVKPELVERKSNDT